MANVGAEVMSVCRVFSREQFPAVWLGTHLEELTAGTLLWPRCLDGMATLLLIVVDGTGKGLNTELRGKVVSPCFIFKGKYVQ